jgi:hypothetical protein
MKMNHFSTLFLSAFLTLFFTIANAADPVSHSDWDALLKKHVSSTGKVDYDGFVTDKAKLQKYCDLLSDNKAKSTWTADQKKAYWINAYNAFTVLLIVNNYPTESIKDLGGWSGPWKVKFFKIGGVDMDLNHIEHEVLLKDFDDPRIHAAINCASNSCPNLLNKAFTESNIEDELTKGMKAFVNDKTKNKITEDTYQVSEIFKWFKDDFTKDQTLIEFLNKYSTVTIKKTAKLSYMKYSWKLNKK